jgi:HEAT repeat protein
MTDLRTFLQSPMTADQIGDLIAAWPAQHGGDVDALLAAVPALLADPDAIVAENMRRVLLAQSARVATALRDVHVFARADLATFGEACGQPAQEDLYAAGLVLPLVATLYVHPDAELRGNAAIILGCMDDVRVYPYLLHALRDNADEVVHAALTYLSPHKIQTEHVRPLLQIVEDINGMLEALFVFFIANPAVTLEPLLECLVHGPTVAQRRAAANFLSNIKAQDDRIFDTLMLALNDADDVREVAIFGLGRLGYRRATADVFRILQSTTNPQVRAHAAEALGKIGDARHVPTLLDMLHSAQQTHDLSLQSSTVIALGHLGDARALEPLQALQIRAAYERTQYEQNPRKHYEADSIFSACVWALGKIGDTYPQKDSA